MKRVTREEQIYLEQRAYIEHDSNVRDYQQLIGEHALIMVDMLQAMTSQPVRMSTVARIGARAKQNAEEWKQLISDEGVDHTKEWKTRRVKIGAKVNQRSRDFAMHVITSANDDLIDYMQAGDLKQVDTFLSRQCTGPGRALGHLCALSARWKKHYDAQKGQDVAATIQSFWKNYVYSLAACTRAIRGRRHPPSEQNIYHYCTQVLLAAKTLGHAWADWVQ